MRIDLHLTFWTLAVLFALTATTASADEIVGSERDARRAAGTSPAVIHLEQGLTTFETMVATELASGNKLVDIEILTTGTSPVTLFSGVFFPLADTVHTLIHGDEAEWNAFLATVGPLDGRWLDLEVGFHGLTEHRYSAIFVEDGNNHGYRVDSNMSDADLQAFQETDLRAGRSIIDFEAYTIPGSGDTAFAAIWTSDARQPMTHLYYDLESGDVGDLFSPLAGRVIDFERYYSAFHGEDRFALVVANVPGWSWYADTLMTQAELTATNAAESDQDTHLIDLNVFAVGTDIRFAGVWGENWKSLNEVAPLPTVNLVSADDFLGNLIQTFEVTKPSGEGQVGFYAKNLRKDVAVGYRANEPFYLGSATKTAAHIRYWMQLEAGHFGMLGQDTEIPYTFDIDTGAPWYVDERPNPGFATGRPGYENNLGQSFTLYRFDRAMMTQSDNAATSALIDEPTVGLSHDSINLNEWLAGVDGVGKGWGLVTSIQDLDRLIAWQGQHTNALKTLPSYFLAPGHTFGPLQRNSFRACTVLTDPPIGCFLPSDCTRCADDNDCASPEFCVAIKDPWGDFATFLGVPIGSTPTLPDYTIGRRRYFGMGLNSATPRAYSNLLEKFWELEFHTEPWRDDAITNMKTGSQFSDLLPCRIDWNGNGTCAPGEGFAFRAVKGGSKGSDSDGTQVCVDTALVRVLDGEFVASDFVYNDEVVTMTWMTRDSSYPCSRDGANNDLRNDWEPSFGYNMLRAVLADLIPGAGSFTPSSVVQGGQIEVNVAVTNIGGPTSGTFDVWIYASTDPVLDGGDRYLGEATFSSVAGQSTGMSGPVTVNIPPTSLPAGTYFLLIDVDQLPGTPRNGVGQVVEFNETPGSNTGFLTPSQLTVLPPCPDVDNDDYSACDASCLPRDFEPCGDCDDTRSAAYPGAPETCNGLDDDCDSIVDNVATPTVAKRITHEDPWPSDYFGSDLANLGDVDGDGFDDLAIGMSGEDLATGNNQGIVRVVSGADFTTICEAVLPAPASYDALGSSVAAAGGDLNGNGTADFVAGVPGYDDPPFASNGAVAAFNLPDCVFIRWMIDPLMDSSDQLGTSVASIGDINGDAIPDIAAGSTSNGLSGLNRGAVSVFSGTDGSVIFTLFDPTAEARSLGVSVAGPGDLTGDGVPDIVAGAHDTDTAVGSARGALYVFSGANGSAHAQYADPSGDYGGDLGISLAVVGDLTGDGVAEIAASSPGDIIGSYRPGSVVIFNGATGLVVQRLFDPLATTGSGFGHGVAAIADISGDGLPDLAVGADLDDDAGPDTGSVFVFDTGSGAILQHLFDPAPRNGDELGSRLVSLGDLSGDGMPEIAAGAPMADDLEGTQAGHVIVFSFEEDCDADGYSPYAGDCNDDSNAVSPGEVERCDSIDNDCNGLTDEDGDGDGFSVCADCNDLDARVHPGAEEICNGIDDDCTNGADLTGIDADGDGFGTPCDCADGDPSINSGAVEICDHVDNDCNGIADDTASMRASARISELVDGVAGDALGVSVSSIGDVTFDGIDDYVAGAPASDLAGSDSGVAVVFDGATGLVHCIAAPSPAYANFGTAVAGIGDVDNDGAGDFAVGAPRRNSVAVDAGAVYVISGNDCATIRELVDASGQSSDRLGSAVAGVGDLTGDGITEIAGGAEWVDTATDQSAGVVLVWNGATGAEIFRLKDSHRGGSRLGASIAGIGDVNADGVPDIVAGAPYDDGLFGSDMGSALVFSGADGSVIHKLFDPAGTGGDDLGTAVAGIGDLSGDAVPDILVGAPDEDTGGPDNGAILVFSGADGSLVQRVALVEATLFNAFGSAVVALPDLNGDGVPEFAGGAIDDDTQAANAGRVLIISGMDYSVLHDLTLPGSSEGANLGASIAAIGDLSGDGFPEIVAGQPGQNTGEDNDAGRVVVFSLESDCDLDGVGPFEGDCDDQTVFRAPGLDEVCDGVDNDCDSAIDEDEDGDGADACVDCATTMPTIAPGITEICNAIDDDCNMQVDEGVDLDGDLFTTPCDCNDGDAGINAAATELCNTIDDDCDGVVDEGFVSPLDQVRTEDPAAGTGHMLGLSLAVVGDVDADGIADFAAGVIGDDGAANNGGAIVLFSGASRSEICRMVDPSARSSDQLGYSVAAIGDVTGDGVPDVVAGARYDDSPGTNSGSAHVFSGATCEWVRMLVDPAGMASDALGESVAGIGDVTGDGVSEIAAGAPGDDEGGLNGCGSVVVFDGATGVFLYKALDLHGRTSDSLGISVSPLGDVDFDGIPDFVAGSILDDTGIAANSGSVSVFSGVDGHWIRSFTDPVAASSDEMGRSLAPAGDMDGDGVPDLLVGSEKDDAGAPNSGSVLAFSGATGTLIRRYSDDAPLSNARLGYSVAAVGDLNGDGVTEVVSGAYDSTRSGVGAGEVVLFDGASGAVLQRFGDAAPVSGDDFGASLLVSDLTGGGVVEIIVGAPGAASAGLLTAGYLEVLSIEPDCDGDGLSPLVDCDDADGSTQGEPEPIDSLVFTIHDQLQWAAPPSAGVNAVYDLVRSADPADFLSAATCVETNDGADTTANDGTVPAPGTFFAYLVRTRNNCGESVRTDATGAPRPVANCP